MISGVFAFVMLVGMLLPWLINLNKRFTVNLVGSLSALVGLYFVWLGMQSGQFSEQIGSNLISMGISLAFGTQELLWLVATLLLIMLHFLIYYRQFMELSLTSLVLYLFSIFAVCGILLSRDLFNLFVMIEVFSISMIGLILKKTSHINALKAFQYLLLNSLAAAMFLLGVVLIYRSTGVLSLDLLLEIASEGSLPGHAMAFIMAAISLKLMLFPLSGWAKNLIGKRGGIDAAYITMLMPMVFVFDLQKLSGLMKSTQVLYLSLLALVTMFVYMYQWIRHRDSRRANIVFVINASFVLLFALHFFLDIYYVLLVYGVLSSIVKILVFSSKEDSIDEELTARGFELNVNSSVLALLLVLFIYIII